MKIASVADVKAHLSAYVKQSKKGPVIVTRNGKAVAALVAVTDGDELERLVLAHSPKFQAILGKSRRQIEETGGIPHDSFWRSVADSARDDKRDLPASLDEYRGPHLSPVQQDFLCQLAKNGFDIRVTGSAKKAIRILNSDHEDCGYINATVIGKHGIFGYKFKYFDHCCVDEAPNKIDEFRQKHGDASNGRWISHAHSKDPRKQHIVVMDLQLAYRIIGVDD